MNVRKLTENNYMVILDKGDSVMESFKRFHKEYAANKVCQIECIGAIEEVEIGYLKHDGKYHYELLQGELELLVAKGNITNLNDDSMVHLHVVVSDIEMKCFGGHLKDAKVSVTMECFVNVYDSKVERKFSESLGINLINL